MAMVLPMFRIVLVRNSCQRSRTDEHVGVKYNSSDGNQSYHGVEVKHILEFVPLPPEKCKHLVLGYELRSDRYFSVFGNRITINGNNFTSCLLFFVKLLVKIFSIN